MKVIAIIQARMGSTRLPNKVMKPIGDLSLIGLLIARLSRSKKINQIIVATSVDKNNQPLVKHVNSLGVDCFQGSEEDVLQRYQNAAKKYNADIVVRITGDCPLIDVSLVDKVITSFESSDNDYVSNNYPATFPDGLDVEVFSYTALESANNFAILQSEREHVTPFIRNSGKFKIDTLLHSVDLSDHRWTVDEQEDFNVVKKICDHFHPNIHFTWEDILELEREKPNIFVDNKTIKRNEGMYMGTGQKLWKRAKQIIPGGNMLLSKRAEMYLPDFWPAYFSEASGCKLKDLDGNEFIDMSIMGIGTNILGYGNKLVDEEVNKVVQRGNMSTLNCPEEVYLAEKLVELHPWADMARFARSGGEANAIAIRIARAATQKDNVAICGYHGWHDWYLSVNHNSVDVKNSQNLDEHLLPGLSPSGVPASLKNTTFPFSYNNFEQLQSLVQEHDIGTIKMEVMRNDEPKDGFLHKVRKLASDNNIVLIFDECTSGFRETNGGLHKKYGVEPDMAMFGKALGNGYAITATIGRREIMEAAQNTFISSTFWTERIGPAAALKTLEVMNEMESWKIITSNGIFLMNSWDEIAAKHNLKINKFGIPALAGFNIDSKYALEYKTYISQEMLKRGFLASNVVYSCIEHTHEIIQNYLEELDKIFLKIKSCEDENSIDSLLDGRVCHAGFGRLN